MKGSTEDDREILRHFYRMMTPQENFDTDKYAYQAEYLGANGIYVWQSKSLGWEVIRGDMPENPSMRDASGNCVMGDVVYMRMPRARYDQLQRARQALVREQRGEQTQQEVRREIDEKISRLVGHDINIGFQFKDLRELADRKGS